MIDHQRIWRAVQGRPVVVPWDAPLLPMKWGLEFQLSRLLSLRAYVAKESDAETYLDAGILGVIAELNELGAQAEVRAICSRWRAS